MIFSGSRRWGVSIIAGKTRSFMSNMRSLHKSDAISPADRHFVAAICFPTKYAQPSGSGLDSLKINGLPESRATWLNLGLGKATMRPLLIGMARH